VKVPNHPKDKRGEHDVTISKVLFIERSDFREVDAKGYKRLAPGKNFLAGKLTVEGKEVGLAHAGAVIKCNEMIKDSNGTVTELRATIEWGLKTKPKGFIHWVSEPFATVEVRLYDKLFKSEEPGSLENWLADINPESLVVKDKVFVDPWVLEAATGTHFQFERTGFFVVDSDSTKEKKVFNRVVSLKQEKWEDE
jgi:glutaminyl-tRNA synthetase